MSAIDGSNDGAETDGEWVRVDVFQASLTGLDDTGRARLYNRLLDREAARAARFRVTGARDRYIAGRVLLRRALSEIAGVPEADWRFGAERLGRPFVEAPEAGRHLGFSPTHADGLVACAVARHRRIGLDIEETDRTVDAEDLATNYFGAQEADRVVSATDHTACKERFFRHWTLKEALLKAHGVGLTEPLDSVQFDPDRDPPALVHSGLDADRSAWRLYQTWPSARHVLAFAVEASAQTPLDVRTHWRRVDL